MEDQRYDIAMRVLDAIRRIVSTPMKPDDQVRVIRELISVVHPQFLEWRENVEARELAKARKSM